MKPLLEKKMEQKIVPKKIYEDKQFLVFKNPVVDSSFKIYRKTEDDFHNTFNELIIELGKNYYKSNPTDDLLIKLLQEKENQNG